MYSERLNNEIIHIRRHERLVTAAESYVDGYVGFSIRHNNISKLVSEDIKYLLALKATELCSHPEMGASFTKAQIQAFASKHGIATSNRVSAIIDLAIKCGYFKVEKSGADRRENLLVPTEQFRSCMIASASIHLTPLSILFGEQYEKMDGEIGHISRRAIDVYFGCAIFKNQNDALGLFTKRDSGYAILMKLLQVSRVFSEQPSKIFALPFTRLSRTFGVSRAHVQKLFHAAEQARLISIRAKGGKEIEIHPRFIKVSCNLIAAVLAIAKVAADLSAMRRYPMSIHVTAMPDELFAYGNASSTRASRI